jgi:predicted nuclease with TOPRIM domain
MAVREREKSNEMVKRYEIMEYEIEKVIEKINKLKQEKTELIEKKHRFLIENCVYRNDDNNTCERFDKPIPIAENWNDCSDCVWGAGKGKEILTR